MIITGIDDEAWGFIKNRYLKHQGLLMLTPLLLVDPWIASVARA
jgi:hypothetical protein